jgi:hypothetical protein
MISEDLGCLHLQGVSGVLTINNSVEQSLVVIFEVSTAVLLNIQVLACDSGLVVFEVLMEYTAFTFKCHSKFRESNAVTQHYKPEDVNPQSFFG